MSKWYLSATQTKYHCLNQHAVEIDFGQLAKLIVWQLFIMCSSTFASGCAHQTSLVAGAFSCTAFCESATN